MPGRKITVQLVGDSKDLEKAFDRAGAKGKTFGERMGVTGSSLKSLAKVGAAGAAVGGLALVTKGLQSSLTAAKEAQVAQVQLKQALRSAGKSYGQYGQQIDSAIQKTSKLAALDDEELSGSFANLVRSTGSVTKATKGMNLAANIARARNISLAMATKMVEKALKGSDTAFKRVGIVVPKVDDAYASLKGQVNDLEDSMKGASAADKIAIQAKIDLIKQSYDAAKASDKQASAQNAIAEATRKFSGSAAAYGKTAAGAQEKLSVAFENLQERVGKGLIPIVTKFLLKLVDLVDWGERNWPKFQAAIVKAFDTIRPIFDGFKDYFTAWVKIIQAVIQGDWGKAWGQIDDVVKAELKIVIESLKLFVPNFYDAGIKFGDSLAKGIVDGLTPGIPDKIKRVLFEAEKLQLGVTQAKVVRAGIKKLASSVPGPAAPAPPLNYGGGRNKGPGLGHRAGGGPVSAGRSYIVGERGPEMLTMGGNGFVSPSGGGGMHIGVIHIHGVQNVRDLAAELERLAKHGGSQTRGRLGGQNLALG